jgi:hypothetical protein
MSLYVKNAEDLHSPVLPPPPEVPTDTCTHVTQQQAEIDDLYRTLVTVCKATWAELEPMPKRKFAARALTDRTRALLDERRRAIESGADSADDWPERRKEFQRAIRDSCRRDWRDWVGSKIRFAPNIRSRVRYQPVLSVVFTCEVLRNVLHGGYPLGHAP